MTTWNKNGSQKLLLTIVKTLTFASSAGNIRMPSPGSTIGELRRRLVWEAKIISKNTITSEFKDKLWEDQELEGKRKLR